MMKIFAVCDVITLFFFLNDYRFLDTVEIN